MSRVYTDPQHYTDIANAIRYKNGQQTAYKPQSMAAAIRAIETEPTIQALSVTANGTYTAPTGVDGYSPVTVNVPSAASPIFITENGVYTHSGGGGYSPITVNVPTVAVTEELSVTANGTYTPASGIDGFSRVEVNVPSASSKLSLFDMEAMIEFCSVQQSPSNGFYFSPAYTCRDQSNSSVKLDIVTMTVDGHTTKALKRNGYNNATTYFLKKIQGGVYNKCVIYAKVYNYGGNYQTCSLEFRSAVSWSNGTGRGNSTKYKSYFLATYNNTAEWINSQEGISINATGPYTVPQQRIEMDISSITNDFFLAIHNCDVYIEIADIYFIRETS